MEWNGHLVLRSNDQIAGFVHEAPFLVNLNGTQPFVESLVVVEL